VSNSKIVAQSKFLSELNEDIKKKNLSLLETYKLIKNCVENNCFENPFLNILSWNVNCLNNKKLNIMKQYLDEWSKSSTLGSCNTKFPLSCSGDRKNYFLDIICFTETWINSESKFNSLHIKNYNCLSAVRSQGKKGGGIMIYIHKNYQAYEVNSIMNDNIEMLLVKILTGKDDYHILTIYRPPNGDLEAFLKSFEEITVNLDRDRLIINGDMNLNILNTSENEIKEYLNLLTSLNLNIINNSVTRRNPITGVGTLLDHVILSENKFCNENSICLTSKQVCVISDHNFVLLMYKMPKASVNNRIVRFKKINMEVFAAKITEQMDILDAKISELNALSVDEYFDEVHGRLMQTVKECTKLVKAKLPLVHRTLPNWADDKYIEMLNTLYNLEEKIDMRRNKGLEHDLLVAKFEELDSIRDKYAIVKAKIYYRRLEIENLNHAWKIINELIGKSKNSNLVPLIETEDGKILQDCEEIANAFQTKFLKIVGNESIECNTNNHKYLGINVADSFIFDVTSPREIFTYIGALDKSKSPGYDDLNAIIFKICNERISIHLANIFNLMVRDGMYPNALKLAAIVPIPKNGKMISLVNSRPISLLPLIDKIFEGIICGQLNRFFENNNILNSFQYGFRSGRGCPDALCMILNHVSKLLNAGKSAILISFDIEKAFDSVCHPILLRKLNFLGIRGKSYELIKSFLTNRKQFVKFSDAVSRIASIIFGVPQGSNLGPLLFSIILNDLSSLKTKATFYQYADDLIAVFPIEYNGNGIDLKNLENDINLLTEFYANNHLKINYEKSNFIAIGTCSQELKVFLKDKLIHESESLKYLGFIIDSELKMINHVDKICISIAQGINALRFLKQNLVTKSLLKFFHAHIQSHISYCSFALLRCRSIDIERVQRLQSKALRLIFDLQDTYPSYDLFTKHAKDFLCVTGVIYYFALIMVRKCITCKDESLPLIQRARSTRRSDVILCNAKKKILADDITHVGCKLYNDLPIDIKSEKNIFLFKVKLKKFLLSRNESLIKLGQFSNKNFFL
jgi:exonuclease III